MALLVKGVSTFIGLTDAPDSYTDEAKKRALVNAGESALEFATEEGGLDFIIDGGLDVITTGEKGHREVPFDCEIASVEIFADQDGAIKVDIWKTNYANFPPANANSICGGNEPEIAASGDKYQDSTLTNWTKTLSKGDVLAYNVDSVTTLTRVTITLKVNKT